MVMVQLGRGDEDVPDDREELGHDPVHGERCRREDLRVGGKVCGRHELHGRGDTFVDACLHDSGSPLFFVGGSSIWELNPFYNWRPVLGDKITWT